MATACKTPLIWQTLTRSMTLKFRPSSAGTKRTSSQDKTIIVTNQTVVSSAMRVGTARLFAPQSLERSQLPNLLPSQRKATSLHKRSLITVSPNSPSPLKLALVLRTLTRWTKIATWFCLIWESTEELTFSPSAMVMESLERRWASSSKHALANMLSKELRPPSTKPR